MLQDQYEKYLKGEIQRRQAIENTKPYMDLFFELSDIIQKNNF